MSRSEVSDLLRVAHRLADAAAACTLPLFRTELRVDNKDDGGFDPVTAADRAAERAMREVLADLRPDDAILGEEEGVQEGRSGLTWVLDPIDGTRAFMAGAPTWGTLIACGPTDGAPFLGIVDQPHIGERFAGAQGTARLTGRFERDLRTRRVGGLSNAVLFTTFPEIGSSEERSAFADVAAKARLTRYGFDCYAYALLALGQVDLVIEAGLNPYDIQAPLALIEAAGGLVTDWRGGPAHGGGRVLAAGCPAVHAEALAILGGRVA